LASPRPVRPRVLHPDRDARGFFANEHTRFAEPEYLSDVAFQTANAVIALRADVAHYRAQLRLAVDGGDPEAPVPYEALLSGDSEDAASNGDISNCLAELDAEALKLRREALSLRELYNKEKQRGLEIDIANDRMALVALKTMIEENKQKFRGATEKLEQLLNSSLKSDIITASTRLQKLEEKLRHLKDRDGELTDEHQKILNGREHDTSEIISAAQQLRCIRHVKEQRKLEIEKLIGFQKIQLQALIDALEEDKRREQTHVNDFTDTRSSRALIRRPESMRFSRRTVRGAEVPPGRIEVPVVVETIRLD
jgi:hypothetical protein